MKRFRLCALSQYDSGRRRNRNYLHGGVMRGFSLLGVFLLSSLLSPVSLADTKLWLSLEVGPDQEAGTEGNLCTIEYLEENYVKVTHGASGPVPTKAQLPATQVKALVTRAQETQPIVYSGGPVGPTVTYRAGARESSSLIYYSSETHQIENRSVAAEKLRELILDACEK